MRSKVTLILMEQLIMVLVFALTAALCLAFFAKADVAAREVARQDAAVLLAQNTAERLKAGETPEQLVAQTPHTLEIVPLNSDTAGLAQAEIRIFYQEKLVFSLVTGWQEG